MHTNVFGGQANRRFELSNIECVRLQTKIISITNLFEGIETRLRIDCPFFYQNVKYNDGQMRLCGSDVLIHLPPTMPQFIGIHRGAC